MIKVRDINKNFSNKEAKELSIKLFLLDRCEGGQKTIDKMKKRESKQKNICLSQAK